jgi:hypothetical protein
VRDDWYEGNTWVGPRSLRVFLRANPGFAAFWLLVTTFMGIGLWMDAVGVRSFLLALPLALVTGTAVTLACMFAFSRGWISDDD